MFVAFKGRWNDRAPATSYKDMVRLVFLFTGFTLNEQSIRLSRELCKSGDKIDPGVVQIVLVNSTQAFNIYFSAFYKLREVECRLCVERESIAM
jgi:hypothetical protein